MKRKDSPLERAAMRWAKWRKAGLPQPWMYDFESVLVKACARHAKKEKK